MLGDSSDVILLKDAAGTPWRRSFVEQILSFISVADLRRLTRLNRTWRNFLVETYQPLYLDIDQTRDHTLLCDCQWGRNWLARVLPTAISVRITGESCLLAEVSAAFAPRLRYLSLCVNGLRQLDLIGVFPQLRSLYICDEEANIRKVAFSAPKLKLCIAPVRIVRDFGALDLPSDVTLVAKLPTFHFYRWLIAAFPSHGGRYHYLTATDGLDLCSLPAFWRDYELLKSSQRMACVPALLVRGIRLGQPSSRPVDLLAELQRRLKVASVDAWQQDLDRLWEANVVGCDYWTPELFKLSENLIGAVWQVMSEVCDASAVVDDVHCDKNGFCYTASMELSSSSRPMTVSEALLCVKYIGCFPIFVHRTDVCERTVTDRQLIDGGELNFDQVESVFDRSRGPWGETMLHQLSSLPNLKHIFLTYAKWASLLPPTSQLGGASFERQSSGCLMLPAGVTRIALLRWDQPIPDGEKLAALQLDYLMFPKVCEDLQQLRGLFQVCYASQRLFSHRVRVLFCQVPYCEATEREILLAFITGQYSSWSASQLSAKTLYRKKWGEEMSSASHCVAVGKPQMPIGLSYEAYRAWVEMYLSHIPNDILRDLPRSWIFPGYLTLSDSPLGTMVSAARLLHNNEWSALYRTGCTLKAIPCFDPNTTASNDVENP